MTGESRGGFGTGLIATFVSAFGVLLGVVLAFISAVCWAADPFKPPAALCSGFGSALALALSGGAGLSQLLGIPASVLVLVWAGLTVRERSMAESFHERMTS
ncbi:hypothetical protein GRX03_04880 [Halovenus sp. WSH3]|uniref:Uncharacterized protein n=1 Tax=Halovenus carboxidivorans TaxID=2692199 RepID=A0A6B0T6N6_9EURY|nr:hypothetical protein [Halovenus carboxidivorans]MXR50942.1 hypothetical protein [Halovenus carboxidivorans]